MDQRKRKTFQTALLISVVFGLCLIWLIYLFSGDPYWEASVKSGNQAFERGNYEWAEKMYEQALRYAREQNPDRRRTIETLLLLRRLYQVQGRDELAEQTMERIRKLRTRED